MHTETSENMILYCALKKSERNPHDMAFVRPEKMFVENIIIDNKEVPRFKFIKDVEDIKEQI